PSSILDLGCGTGAVITELQSRNVGKRYMAVDYSKDAIEYLEKNSTGIKTQVADLTSGKVSVNDSFDLVIAIHVLQHLEEPDKFIKNIIDNIKFTYLIIEVPLEDLFINRVASMLGIHDKNPTGTLQFFNKKTINDLLTKSGISIVDQKKSTPITNLKTLKILKERYDWNKFQMMKKVFTTYLLPLFLGPIKRYLHYSYYTVLCVRKA
ncbi:MAG: class I SAM-dependent methyltransferase, partial [Candidatus Margulisbacteria bacterium]|nr:class I SAM-dependent methyltransferase [Candidatus Margulisiibacteriota bacterium]